MHLVKETPCISKLVPDLNKPYFDINFILIYQPTVHTITVSVNGP